MKPLPSVYGKGEKITLHALKTTPIHGKWLNLGGGDGRYLSKLLTRVTKIISTDNSTAKINALSKRIPKKYNEKIDFVVHDFTKRFPFQSETFDGVIFTGVMHLYPPAKMKKTLGEVNRVLKRKGRLIIDCATESQRISLEGKIVKFYEEYPWTNSEVTLLMKKAFSEYRLRFETSSYIDLPAGKKHPYFSKGSFVLAIGQKN